MTADTADTLNGPTDTTSRRKRIAQRSLSGSGIIAAIVLHSVLDGPSMWGLLPLFLYAALLILDVDIVMATLVAMVAGFLMLGSTPDGAATIMGTSLASDIVVIGIIIVLGSGLGEVLTRTGAAPEIVRLVIQRLGADSPVRAQLGIMISTGLLVIALGTLIGAFALAAPLVIPIAARLGFTRSGTALMMFIGGTCGMFVAPFVGSMVAIRTASGISYPEFVLTAGGPLALACFTVGFFLVRWNLRHPVDENDFYTEDDSRTDDSISPHAQRSALAFGATFLVVVTYAIVAGAGTSFAALALATMAAVAGLSGGLGPTQTLTAIYDGCGRLFEFFLLFWFLAALFAIIEELDPYTVLLGRFGDDLQTFGTFGFLVVVGLIGWLGIQGASAAQVVLVDKLFGPTAALLGVPVPAWSVVLLASAQADTYGPFPGVNMLAPVGLARSTALKRILYSSWVLLIVSLAVYAVEIAILR